MPSGYVVRRLFVLLEFVLATTYYNGAFASKNE